MTYDRFSSSGGFVVASQIAEVVQGQQDLAEHPSDSTFADMNEDHSECMVAVLRAGPLDGALILVAQDDVPEDILKVTAPPVLSEQVDGLRHPVSLGQKSIYQCYWSEEGDDGYLTCYFEYVGAEQVGWPP